jgi:hypothetical protein
MTVQRVVVAAGVIGLAVLTVALFLASLASTQTVRVESFQRSADPRKLIVNVTLGLGDELVERTVDENGRTITVTVRVRQPTGPRDLIGIPVPVVVTLREPLGARTVLDFDGSPVRDLGQYLGPAQAPRS